MKTILQVIIFLGLPLFFGSCMSLLGLRQERDIKDKKILKLADRFGLRKQSVYKIDSVAYAAILSSKNLNARELKDLQQPNQILVFENNGTNTAYLINCNIGGFPLLKWNRCKGFDSIPLKQGYFIKPKVNLTPEDFENVIVKLRNTAYDPEIQHTGYKYYVLWSRVLFRNSKKMLKLVEQHIARIRKVHPVEVKYIYTDSMYF